ncbi:MAG TPA: FtsX-like permease family protein [Vicinamibacterales bacterium]|nr:FtsX-like permease family protein [Vicinamibacterales bacterium]
MRAPWPLERLVQAVLLWSAARVSPRDQSEIAEMAWLACADAGERGGAGAFVRTTIAEVADLLSLPFRMRAGLGPRLTGPSRVPSKQGSPMAFIDDFRRAGRRLRSGRGPLALAVAMLALAIGVTTTMFTVLDALMLHPVPFRDAGRLTSVALASGRMVMMNGSTPAQFHAWRAGAGFARVEGAAQSPVTFETPAGLVSKGGARISSGLFDMLGVQPILGRTFLDGEGRAGTDDRILLSEEIWTTLYNRDPGIVGRRIRVSGVPTEVVGVMPAGFRFPYANSVTWQPIDFDAPPPGPRRANPQVYARLKPGIPGTDALRLADEALRAGVTLEPEEHTAFRPIAAGMVDPYSRRAVTALSVGVGLVFLVLCANAMNVLLTRLSSRAREFGVCAALGASRARLLREAIAETLLIALAAAAAGLALAAGFVQIAHSYLPDAFLASTLTPVAISWRAVAATSLLGLLAAAIAGVTPAWMATRVDAANSLRGANARGGTDARSHTRLARGLLIAEVALAAALLAGAGQLVRTFVNLMHADRGLNAEGVITSWVALPPFAFKDRPGRIAFASALEDRLRQLPGVTQISLSGGVPPGGGAIYFGSIRTDAGREVEGEVNMYDVSPRFFELFRIRLVAGGGFHEPSQPDEVIVGAQLFAKLWPGEGLDTVSGRLAPGHTLNVYKTTYRVVGVAQEIRNPSLDPRADSPELYFPLVVERGGRVEATAFGSGQIFAALRCNAACPPLETIAAAIRSVSAQVVIARLGPMEGEYLKGLAAPRAAAALAAVFAIVALLASAGGLFGVLTAAVARRRREFGIRVALGIEPSRLTQLVLADAARLAVIGLAFGVAGAWVLSRALSSLTYGVTPADPATWTTVVGSLATAVLLAAWRPSRHAARVSPSELLRAE